MCSQIASVDRVLVPSRMPQERVRQLEAEKERLAGSLRIQAFNAVPYSGRFWNPGEIEAANRTALGKNGTFGADFQVPQDSSNAARPTEHNARSELKPEALLEEKEHARGRVRGQLSVEHGHSHGHGHRSRRSQPSRALRKKLARFYRVHAPEKLTGGWAKLDHIIELYRGREESLWQNLRAKYGVASTGAASDDPPSLLEESQ